LLVHALISTIHFYFIPISAHFATVTLKITQCGQAVGNITKLALFVATKYARNTEIKIYTISKTVQTGTEADVSYILTYHD